MNQPRTTRDGILDAARSLFAQHGYRGASVRAVIRRAGVNLGAVTYHFGGKPGLYEAVLDSLIGPLEERVRAAADGPGDPLERIERVVGVVLDHLAHHREQAPIIQHELALQRPLPERARRWIGLLFDTLTRLIVEGQSDGSIVSGPPGMLAASVVAQPFYFAIAGLHLTEMAGLSIVPDRARPEVAEHVIRTVRRMLGAPRRDS